MAVLKVLTRVQKKKDAYTLGGTVSTAILESSMKVVPGEEVMGICQKMPSFHIHDYSTAHSSQDVAATWVSTHR